MKCLERKRSEHYVNNKEFLNAIVIYRNQCKRAEEAGRPTSHHKLSWRMFLEDSNTLSYKPNFVNYMFREDMICDGIENCVQYIKNFDPENLQIHLLILLKSYTMHFYVVFKKKSDKWISV